MTTSSGIIKRYETVASLGAGGMANVYLALSRGPDGFRKAVVIKKLRATYADDPEFVQMFREEARLAARLNHPNIVQTLDFGTEGDRYVIVMEYLEGQSLHAIQRRAGPDGLPLANHLSVLTQVLTALRYAHDLKDFDGTPLRIVHRDVSPHNVFVTYAGQTKLVDFGIAKAVSRHQDITHNGTRGKIGYMAPEQERGDPLDARTDLFAVGVMLWEALVGRQLWAGLSDIAIISRLHFAEIPTPSEANSEVHPALEQICMRALAHRPSDRFADADQLKAALEGCMAELGLRAQLEQTGRLVAELFAEDHRRISGLLAERMAASSASPIPADAARTTNAPPSPEEPSAKPSISSHRAPQDAHLSRGRLAASIATLAAVAAIASVLTTRISSCSTSSNQPAALPAQALSSQPAPFSAASTAAENGEAPSGAPAGSGSVAPTSPSAGAPESSVAPPDTIAPAASRDAGVRFDDPGPP